VLALKIVQGREGGGVIPHSSSKLKRFSKYEKLFI